jgi:hypothetical protein
MTVPGPQSAIYDYDFANSTLYSKRLEKLDISFTKCCKVKSFCRFVEQTIITCKLLSAEYAHESKEEHTLLHLAWVMPESNPSVARYEENT